MEVMPGTHLMDQVPHRDTFRRQQPADPAGRRWPWRWTPAGAVRLDLRPGEMSLHHVRLIHGSPPNPSDGRRIGFAIRYIPTSVRQLFGEDSATLVRGVDRFNSFAHEPVPSGDMQPEMLALHKETTERNAKVLYRGTPVQSYSDPTARGSFR